MRKELTGFGDVLKKIKNYCKPFVIVTGPALALPPCCFTATQCCACTTSLDANDSYVVMQTRIVYMMLRRRYIVAYIRQVYTCGFYATAIGVLVE